MNAVKTDCGSRADRRRRPGFGVRKLQLHQGDAWTQNGPDRAVREGKAERQRPRLGRRGRNSDRRRAPPARRPKRLTGRQWASLLAPHWIRWAASSTSGVNLARDVPRRSGPRKGGPSGPSCFGDRCGDAQAQATLPAGNKGCTVGGSAQCAEDTWRSLWI